ncbi:hypothetical protein AGR7A_Lc180073 [Agrobacterium deltaense NCPPB 1641]|uniref:Uncharacterized protein n=1 Tax=Agrobacterium deltaense NCPPB 1641 TaxID=1183425 RepID=A0A1S7U3T6_9HYPH|nr:hypothetical protein AGR7A_Lc180073 [Agrobacterium deltaense NCPPB 1641]
MWPRQDGWCRIFPRRLFTIKYRKFKILIEFPDVICAFRKPQAASRKPQAASRKPQAASRKPQAASRKPQAAAYSIVFPNPAGLGPAPSDPVRRTISETPADAPCAAAGAFLSKKRNRFHVRTMR